jgi:hypothetical protein
VAVVLAACGAGTGLDAMEPIGGLDAEVSVGDAQAADRSAFPDASGEDAVSVDARDAASNDAAPSDVGPNDVGPSDGSASDGSVTGMDATSQTPIALSCFETTSAPAPSPCPAIIPSPTHASFCFRAMWPGVTSVDVYGGFGTSSDWMRPLLSLHDDGTGMFSGTATLAAGSYPYLFRVTSGGADGLVPRGQYVNDQSNPAHVASPPGSPTYSARVQVQRAVSNLTVPQTAPSLVHLRGQVRYDADPQPCFFVALNGGNQLTPVRLEHWFSNFAESDAAGSFDFLVAPSSYQLTVTLPKPLMHLDGGVPDPLTTPAIGYGATAVTVSTSDVDLDPINIAYHDYATMAPTPGPTSLPATFHFTVINGAASGALVLEGADVPGNDPWYTSRYMTTTPTAAVFQGTFAGMLGQAMPGRTYYWGTFQNQRASQAMSPIWKQASLLFPITFQ